MPSASSASPSTTRRTTVQSTLDQHDSADDSASTSSRTQPRLSRSRRTDTTTPATDTADADPNSPRRSPRLNCSASNIDMLDGETSELMLRDLRKNREFVDDEDGEERGVGDVDKSEFGNNEKDYAENGNGVVGNANGYDHTSALALSKKDIGNIALLVILYLLQGIPVGLSFGSIPFLLKSRLSYSQIAIFSLSSWPYSLKLLWSPVVDSAYWPNIGRRKSWIVPIQILTGFLFLWLGSNIDEWMAAERINVHAITSIFFITIFFCATQDIAVDGWALTLLSKSSLSYASTAQTVGLNTGYFLSFTVFLALNSAEFSNKYFRSAQNAQEMGVLPLGSYMIFWAFMYFAITAWLIIVKKEDRTTSDEDLLGITGVYTTIWKICKLPHMKSFILVLLTAKIGFIANESVTGLKLLEKGFSKEDLALAVLVDFPFQILFGYYAAKWSSGPRPLKPWLYAFYGRLFFAAAGMAVVRFYPANGHASTAYFWIIIASTVLSSFMSTVQFVSISAFMTTIADPLIGGTYMTLLNTFSNFGGTWPKFFVLEAVDFFTVATCDIPKADGSTLSCVSEAGKAQCRELNGSCLIQQDGYYYASTVCVIIGLVMLLTYVKPTVQYLETMPKKMWRLNHK